jgi:hypothetical protein
MVTSCFVTKQSVSGFYLYQMKNNPEMMEAIHLKVDGSFNYEFSNSMVPYPKLTGTWQLKSDTIILNSTEYSVSFGDTIKLNNKIYFAKNHSLKRKTHRGNVIKLKKIKLHSQNLIFNYEAF